MRLALDGFQLVLCDLERAEDAMAKTVAACQGAHSEAQAPATAFFDVTDSAAVNAALDRIVDEHGTPTAVYNNAGYQGQFTNTVDYPSDDFRMVMDVNVTGVFHVLQACGRAMMTAGTGGSIVNSASMAATGAPNMVAYSASKAAVIGMTKSAAKDLAPHNILVNAISPAFIGPGAMWTRQVELQAEVASQYYPDDPSAVAEAMIGDVPLRRYGTLDEVAAGALFLLSDQASYLTGFNLEIAGGIR